MCGWGSANSKASILDVGRASSPCPGHKVRQVSCYSACECEASTDRIRDALRNLSSNLVALNTMGQDIHGMAGLDWPHDPQVVSTMIF